ncbi:MAG: hypothetical protein ACKO1J_06850 [Tagaea sp.]
MIEDALTSGRLIDAILALLGAQIAVLWFREGRTASGLAPGSIAFSLIPGLFLLLAWRFHLGAADHRVVLVLLAAAGVANAADLAKRWRSRRP